MIAIKTEKLSKNYGPVKALQALDLEVPENRVFGFLGPNGAGKSTTVKLLTGFAHPSAGQAWVAGEKVDAFNLELRRKIGYLPDVPAFYDWMSGREFMRMGGELFGLSSPEINQRTDELLGLVGMLKSGKRRIGGYSRGMRQRLGIAQALINRPKVLFMDEPTSALDPIGRREILELISRLKQTATIFMSTHILSDVERICDMVGIIDKGRLITVSEVSELQKKFAPSVFEMDFIEDAGVFVESLKKVPWLSGAAIIIDRGHPRVRVTASDLNRARRELPGLISLSGLTLTRYELVMPDLEDIFLDIINGGKEK
ncbi:MAG TPA: ABC transporter ATP-binding protein [Dehalococcoidales bacterium]|nr:ABC transporter ATP-binding protein [Dehalococcoidales bacterium]